MIEQPAGRLLTMALDRLHADYLEAINRAAMADKEDRGFPESAQFDPARRVWMVPTLSPDAIPGDDGVPA